MQQYDNYGLRLKKKIFLGLGDKSEEAKEMLKVNHQRK